MDAGYTVETNGDIALSAATAKTILSFVAASDRPFQVVELSVSFDGTTAAAEPVTVELMKSTEATAGTSTTHTAEQTYGPSEHTHGGTAKRNFTAEPTVLTNLKRWLVHPQGGLLLVQWPLGREPMQPTTADAIVVRCTAPATVNVQGYMEVSP